MKYDAQLKEVHQLLANSKQILIALPVNPSVDELAAGLAIFLSLAESGKEPFIATEGVIRVGHSNLFGVGQIQNKLPQTSGGDFIITIGGVVVSDGNNEPTVPALEKIDWHAAGADFNLVFHVKPGQTFEPNRILPHFEGEGFDLIITVGAANLNDLGLIYSTQPDSFLKSKIINIDNDSSNLQFGAINLIDSSVSSISEMIYEVARTLNLVISPDTASNILSGIFATTDNLRASGSADTYEVVSLALRAGGQRPIFEAADETLVENEIAAPNKSSSSNLGFDLTQQLATSLGAPIGKVDEPADSETTQSDNQPSPEEVPSGERANTSPETDWLTPKIYNSKSLS